MVSLKLAKVLNAEYTILSDLILSVIRIDTFLLIL